MAYADCTAAPRADARSPPPFARPGFGKRLAPGQQRRRPGDFAHLPRREASIAAYLDRLPEGADISVKTLARTLPDYGQCALRTALRRLSEAGHLRRITEHRRSEQGVHLWVTRTYFSRTARDDAWWAALCSGDTPPPDHATPVTPPPLAPPQTSADGALPHPPAVGQGPQSPAPRPRETDSPRPSQRPLRSPGPGTSQSPGPRPARRSRAYAALAALGRTEPRMTLSAADCAALEDLAEQWLARDVPPDHFRRALTTGLPPEVHHPGALARTRLLAKMPPEPEPESELDHAAPPGVTGSPRRLMECTLCRTPGRPEALPGGLCGTCRGTPPPPRHAPSAAPPADVPARVQLLREASVRTREGRHR